MGAAMSVSGCLIVHFGNGIRASSAIGVCECGSEGMQIRAYKPRERFEIYELSC